MAQNIIYSLWRGTKDPWLCLLTKLLLFDTVVLFALFLHFFNFSDWIYSLTKVFHRRKVGWGYERQRPCSVSKGGSCSASKGDTDLVSWIFCNRRMSTLADWSIDWLICSFIQDRESTNFLPDLRVSLLKCGPWTRTWEFVRTTQCKPHSRPNVRKPAF